MGKPQEKEIFLCQLSLSLEDYLVISLPVPNHYLIIETSISRTIRQHFLQAVIPEPLESGSTVTLLIGDEVEVSEEMRADDCDFELHDIHSERARLI